jgi:hypothetical protein
MSVMNRKTLLTQNSKQMELCEPQTRMLIFEIKVSVPVNLCFVEKRNLT